jgi:hypothetical protein
VSGDLQAGTVGQALGAALVVQVNDRLANPIANATVNFSVTQGGGSVATASAITGANGQAQTLWTLGPSAPAQSAQAAVVGFGGSPVAFTATGAPASGHLVLMTAPSGSAPNRTAFATQPVVQLQNSHGDPVALAGVAVSVSLTSGGGTIGGSASATTTSAGAATFTNLSIIGAVGVRTLTFAAAGFTNATASVSLTAGAATTTSVSAGNNQSAGAGTAVATGPAVRVADQDGNGVPGTSVTFVVTAGGGSVSGATQTTASDGTATLGGWTLGPSAAVNRVEARVAGISAAVIEARSWTISPLSIALHSIGESQTVTAAVGDSTGTGSLTISAESRWLQEIAVADTASLKAGIVRATAPGSARVHVRAFGLDLGDVAVSVVPATPIVFSVQQPSWPKDPTLVVRGYEMNALPTGAVLVGGSPATKITADSAQFTANPGISSSTDCVLSVTDTVAVPGFTVLSKGTARRFTAVNAFAVGDTLTMQGGSFCLKLPPQVASYAIAQVDRSLMDRAVTTPQAYWDTVSSSSPYTFSASDQNVAATAAASAFRGASALSTLQRSNQLSVVPPDIRTVAAAASATDIWNQATPWAVGDLISTHGWDFSVDIPWRVMRIYPNNPNNFVLAISQADSALLWTPAVIAKLDSAFTFLLGSVGQSIYQTTFAGSPVPITSPGSGQYLVLLERRAQQGFAICNLTGGTGGSSTDLQIGSVLVGVLPANGQGGLGDPPASFVLETMAHEYAHSWDCMRTGTQSARWSIEGLADFVESEMQRLFMGLPVDGNLPIVIGRWNAPMPYSGQFQSGYGESSSFMQHLASRLTSLYGVPWEQARATVILGSSEGWYGQSSSAGPGLAARLRQIAGPQWEPVDARLDWILSLAADDRATGAAAKYNYAALFQTWRSVQGNSVGIPGGWAHFYRGAIVAGAGQSVSGTARADDNGYIIVDDPNGLGAALELKSSIGTLVWRVLRYH